MLSPTDQKPCDKTSPRALAGLLKQPICCSVKAQKNFQKWEECIVFELFITVIDIVLKLTMSIKILASQNYFSDHILIKEISKDSFDVSHVIIF